MATPEIQLWSIDLSPAGQESQAFLSLLSDDEQKRAARFSFETHRDRWVTGRAMLRTILASVTNQTPESVAFEYDAHAKPRLPFAPGNEHTHFNLTHSGDLALLAVTSVGPVGIDVERIKPMSNMDAVVERFFSCAERRAFDTVSGDENRLEAFYKCWTRKEAYLKALGCGISKPTGAFDVTFLPDTEPRIDAIEGDRNAAADWLLFDLDVTSGYVGALAIQSEADVDLAWRDAGPVLSSKD